MGDRCNIIVKHDDEHGVVIYTHWGGYEALPDVLATLAVEEVKGRWTDDNYLTRIIFDRLSGRSLEGTTGFGLYAWRDEAELSAYNDDQLAVLVDVPAQTVTQGSRVFAFGDPHTPANDDEPEG